MFPHSHSSHMPSKYNHPPPFDYRCPLSQVSNRCAHIYTHTQRKKRSNIHSHCIYSPRVTRRLARARRQGNDRLTSRTLEVVRCVLKRFPLCAVSSARVVCAIQEQRPRFARHHQEKGSRHFAERRTELCR